MLDGDSNPYYYVNIEIDLQEERECMNLMMQYYTVF